MKEEKEKSKDEQIEEVLNSLKAGQVQKLVRLADILDKSGLYSEANVLDTIIQQAYLFRPNDLVLHKFIGVGKVGRCAEDYCEVIFKDAPKFIPAEEVKGKTIYFEARSGDKAKSGFYQVLNKPVPYVIEQKEVDLEGKEHLRRRKIFVGSLRLVDAMGITYTVEDYPLGREFIGVTKVKPEDLKPYQPRPYQPYR